MDSPTIVQSAIVPFVTDNISDAQIENESDESKQIRLEAQPKSLLSRYVLFKEEAIAQRLKEFESCADSLLIAIPSFMHQELKCKLHDLSIILSVVYEKVLFHTKEEIMVGWNGGMYIGGNVQEFHNYTCEIPIVLNDVCASLNNEKHIQFQYVTEDNSIVDTMFRQISVNEEVPMGVKEAVLKLLHKYEEPMELVVPKGENLLDFLKHSLM